MDDVKKILILASLIAASILFGGCHSFSERSGLRLPVSIETGNRFEHSEKKNSVDPWTSLTPTSSRILERDALYSSRFDFSATNTAAVQRGRDFSGSEAEKLPVSGIQNSKRISTSDIVDPFLQALSPNSNSSETASVILSKHDSSISEQSEINRNDDKKHETQKNETNSDITVASMEVDLLKNNWVRNHELTRWIENGMKNPNENSNSDQLKRLAEINRLNMSSDELRKKGNQNLEYSDGLLSTWRWYHPEIEEILKIPPRKRPNPDVFLQDEKYDGDHYRTVRANAAVLMGRTNDQLAKEYLLQAVADKNLRVPLRCAAAETLGKLSNVSVGELIPLIDHVKERKTTSVNPLTELPEERFSQGIRELWTELLVSVSEKIAPWEHPCFIEPLQSRDPKMRLETVRLWQNPEKSVRKFSNEKKKRRLPEEFLDYARSEIDLTIRIEIVKTLGQWKEPEILEIVRADLNKGPALCYATLDALAEAGCKEAIPLTKEKLHDSVGRNRAKAVQTLRKFGCLDDVFRLHDDPAWEVRIEVARTIADHCSPQTAKLALDYLSDTVRVQEATIDAVATWPLEDAASILLEALKCNLQTTRKRALDVLVQYVPEAKQYNVVAKPESIEEERRALSVRLEEYIEKNHVSKTKPSNDGFEKIRDKSSVSPVAFLDSNVKTQSKQTDKPDLLLLAEVRRLLDEWGRPGKSWGEREVCVERLVSLEDRLLPIVEYLHEIDRRSFPNSFDDVLAKVDPLFAIIVRLDGDDVNDRRRAATELNRWCKIREIGEFTLHRIQWRTDGETDSQTLATLLEALVHIDGNAARKQALLMLENRTDSDIPTMPPEFLRRACTVLRQNGTPEDLAGLSGLLYDRNPDIVRAALESVVGILENDERNAAVSSEQRQEIVQILKSLLMQEDRLLQADVAVVLHVLRDSAGEETLRRLSRSKDSKIRLYAVRCIDSLEDPVFVPILIQLLDDRGSVRQSALKALPKLIGEDIGSTETNDMRFAELSETDRKVARWKHWAEQQIF